MKEKLHPAFQTLEISNLYRLGHRLQTLDYLLLTVHCWVQPIWSGVGEFTLWEVATCSLLFNYILFHCSF